MKKEVYNVGIIGLGDISQVYINNLKKYPIVNLLACSCRSLEKATRIAKANDIPRPYPGTAELLADPDLDVILNLTLPGVHGPINCAALEAGKHVYTEKPLAKNRAEATEIMAIAASKNLTVGSAPDTFLGGRLQACRTLIDTGRIGRIIGASAFVVSHGHEWHHPNPDFFYQPGAGPLLDIGPYYMTALLSLLGPVRSVCAMTNRAFDERVIESNPRRGESIPVDVDTHISANLAFRNGAIGTLITSFDVWDSELPRLEIYGTKGTICLRDVDPLSGPNLFGGDIWLTTRENYRWTSNPRPPHLAEWVVVKHDHPFNETSHAKNSRGIGLIDMVYAIQQGRAPRASGDMAYHSLDVMESILESAGNETFIPIQSTFELPSPLPKDFPLSEQC
ncbi:MAG TPA: Gfo/Idh/MocA family oxidoreductase [Clostridiaceae bacterium]|nr:Gfo/Idh/MocA family oxidoreductase [Clostridiaceae bacterium]